MAKAKKKASLRKKAARKAAPTKTANLKPTAKQVLAALRALHDRITNLERRLAQSQDAGVRPALAASIGAGPGADGEMVPIGFKKTTGPDDVRVTLLDDGEKVLRSFQSEGTSKPRRKKAEIDVQVEVNGGAAVNIELKNATPSPLSDRGTFRITVI